MLILTRKSGEGIRIGDTIILRVIEVRGNQVRLGIKAPKDVSIHREEVYEEMRAEAAKEDKGQPFKAPTGHKSSPKDQPITAETDETPKG